MEPDYQRASSCKVLFTLPCYFVSLPCVERTCLISEQLILGNELLPNSDVQHPYR